MIAKGAFLAYFNEKPPPSYKEGSQSARPNGVFEIARLKNIKKCLNKSEPKQ